MIAKFQKILIEGEVPSSSQDINNHDEEEKGDDPFYAHDEDELMEDTEVNDWDLQGIASNENDYIVEINKQLLQERAEEHKKGGGNSLSFESMMGLINSQSVKLFTGTKFYKQVLAA